MDLGCMSTKVQLGGSEHAVHCHKGRGSKHFNTKGLQAIDGGRNVALHARYLA